jgi:hypothetical protein
VPPPFPVGRYYMQDRRSHKSRLQPDFTLRVTPGQRSFFDVPPPVQQLTRAEAEQRVLARMQRSEPSRFGVDQPVRYNAAVTNYEDLLDHAIATEQSRTRPSPGAAANAHRPTLVYNYPLPEDHSAITQPSRRAAAAQGKLRQQIEQERRDTAASRLRRVHGPLAGRSPRSMPQSTAARSTATPTTQRVVAGDDLDGAIEAATRRAVEASLAHTRADQPPPPPVPNHSTPGAQSPAPGHSQLAPAPRLELTASPPVPTTHALERPADVAEPPAVPAVPREAEQWELRDFSYEALIDLGTMAVSTGLSKQQLARYRAKPYPAGGPCIDCPVCLDDVVAGQPTLTLGCNHVFHEACIRAWLGRTNRCPTCRFEVPRR